MGREITGKTAMYRLYTIIHVVFTKSTLATKTVLKLKRCVQLKHPHGNKRDANRQLLCTQIHTEGIQMLVSSRSLRRRSNVNV